MATGEDLVYPIFCGVVGSRLYNTHSDTSDFDYQGVYVLPPYTLLGIGTYEKTTRDPIYFNDVFSAEFDRGDFVAYELRHFVQLALKGNPTILDSLFANPDYWLKGTYRTKDWLNLYQLRRVFLTENVRAAYVGYAMAQVKQLKDQRRWTINPPVEGDADYDRYMDHINNQGTARKKIIERFGYDTKRAAHALRLVYQGYRLIKTGDHNPTLEGSEQEDVISVLLGTVDFEPMIDSLESDIRTLRTEKSVLPVRISSPDWNLIDRLVTKIHLSYIKDTTT